MFPGLGQLGVAPKLFSLVAKYGTLKAADLTVDVVTAIAGALSVPITADQALVERITAAMRESDIDTLADLAGSPEVLKKVVGFFQPQVQTRDIIRQCNHCGELNYYEVTL